MEVTLWRRFFMEAILWGDFYRGDILWRRLKIYELH